MFLISQCNCALNFWCHLNDIYRVYTKFAVLALNLLFQLFFFSFSFACILIFFSFLIFHSPCMRFLLAIAQFACRKRFGINQCFCNCCSTALLQQQSFWSVFSTLPGAKTLLVCYNGTFSSTLIAHRKKTNLRLSGLHQLCINQNKVIINKKKMRK